LGTHPPDFEIFHYIFRKNRSFSLFREGKNKFHQFFPPRNIFTATSGKMHDWPFLEEIISTPMATGVKARQLQNPCRSKFTSKKFYEITLRKFPSSENCRIVLRTFTRDAQAALAEE